MLIAVDAYGGDNCPQAAVEGSFAALDSRSDLSIALVGRESELAPMIASKDYGGRLSIIPATEIVDCTDSPTEVVKEKPDSSMVVALNSLKQNSDAVVSAGSTGALLVGGIFKVGRIRGVARPALAAVLPTVNGGEVIFLDCGANAECTEQMLLGFARMGSAYMSAVCGVQSPRVGLLNNGTEATKGDVLHRAAYELLQGSGLNFGGNMEAREIFSGRWDVVVADGFSGNIAIKMMEGTAGTLLAVLNAGIEQGDADVKNGAKLLDGVLKNTAKALDYTERGGAVLLGLKKPVVKTHGASDAKAFKATILQAAGIVEGDFCAKFAATTEE